MKRFLWIKYYIAALIFAPLIFKGLEAELGPFDSDRVCTSCHSMKLIAEEYMKSTHYRGRTGMKTGCVECHTRGGLISIDGITLLGKDLFYEVVKPIRGKDDLETRRPALAKKVRDMLVESESGLCIRCHSEETMLPGKDRGKKAHEDGKAKGEGCIECHYNLVHARVPWEGEKKEELEDMLIEPNT